MGKRAPQAATTIDVHLLHPEIKQLKSALVAPCPKTLHMNTYAHNYWQPYNDNADSSSSDIPLPFCISNTS